MNPGPIRTLVLLLAALMLTPARAAPPTAPIRDPFLAQLAGDWDMVAKVPGKADWHQRGEGRWVLNDSWLLLRIIDTRQPPAYQASVYLGYDPKAGDYIAHWLDQFGAAGARVTATGRRDGQTLVLVFPYAEGEFRDTLTLASDGNSGSLLLESQAKDGSWSTFASYTLRRRHA